jgi:phosphatidylinositol glycan class B
MLVTTTRFRQSMLVILLLLLPNMIILVYLGTFHQRAPIEINHRIRKLAHYGGNTQYRIHYLMGCHSTPLYSHLHIPFIQMDAWTLDCSPKCRRASSPNVICESDFFSQDPVRFVEEAYYGMDDDDDDDNTSCTLRDEEGSCKDDAKRSVPDFLAVFAGDAAFLREHFARMGLKEVERFSHSINGLKVGSLQFGDDFTSDAFRHFRFGVLEISVDDMVLFAKPELSV